MAKVERKEAEFQPVVITLENQEEIDQLCALIKASSPDYVPMWVRNIVIDLGD